MGYQHDLLDGALRLYHRHFAVADMQDIDDHSWRSWTGFSVPVAGGIRTGLEYEIDYDSQPAPGDESFDHILRAKVGYAW